AGGPREPRAPDTLDGAGRRRVRPGAGRGGAGGAPDRAVRSDQAVAAGAAVGADPCGRRRQGAPARHRPPRARRPLARDLRSAGLAAGRLRGGRGRRDPRCHPGTPGGLPRRLARQRHHDPRRRAARVSVHPAGDRHHRGARALVLEATLSFLGLGVQPPTPSWGGMVHEGREYLDSAWWISTAPGIVLMLTSIIVSRTGDWLRDLLDPTLRGE